MPGIRALRASLSARWDGRAASVASLDRSIWGEGPRASRAVAERCSRTTNARQLARPFLAFIVDNGEPSRWGVVVAFRGVIHVEQCDARARRLRSAFLSEVEARRSGPSLAEWLASSRRALSKRVASRSQRRVPRALDRTRRALRRGPRSALRSQKGALRRSFAARTVRTAPERAITSPEVGSLFGRHRKEHEQSAAALVWSQAQKAAA